jgi:ATP-dependent Clp protease ATP-binding subunit ClpX
MARASEGNEQLLCSFCGKSQRQVKKLIAGPGVYICDECIDLCNEIIDEELTAPAQLDLDNLPRPRDIYVGPLQHLGALGLAQEGQPF